MFLDEALETVTTDWKDVIESFDLTKINTFLEEQYAIYGDAVKTFPPKPLIFNCFNFFNVKDTKVVIIGQDPYINEGEAMGMAFSVPEGKKVPPSLRNIIKEINRSMGSNKDFKNGDLTAWAEQGVLLLNTALTVRQYKSGTHMTKWKHFTNYMLKYINDNCDGLVFMLWGNHAIKYEDLIDKDKHHVLKSGHPSPLNRTNPFLENNHFVKCNELLKDPIDW